MRSPLLTTLAAAGALIALTAVASAQPASTPPPGYPPATGSVVSPDPAAPGAPAPRYESDGNANMPRATNAPGAPNYTQGSGQSTGGPARELIPR